MESFDDGTFAIAEMVTSKILCKSCSDVSSAMRMSFIRSKGGLPSFTGFSCIGDVLKRKDLIGEHGVSMCVDSPHGKVFVDASLSPVSDPVVLQPASQDENVFVLVHASTESAQMVLVLFSVVSILQTSS